MTTYQGGNVTLTLWHGGKFEVARTGEMIYLGGQGRTYKLDPGEFCYWDILDYAKKMW